VVYRAVVSLTFHAVLMNLIYKFKYRLNENVIIKTLTEPTQRYKVLFLFLETLEQVFVFFF